MPIIVVVLVGCTTGPIRLAAQESQIQTEPIAYKAYNLGNLSGTSSSANTINEIGWAMGSANLSGNTVEHAMVWVYGLKSDLGTLGGPNSDVSWPVKNNQGLISGWSETSAIDPFNESWSCTAFNPTETPTGHVCVGFVWQWGEMTALPTLGGYNGFAAGANNHGQIAGWAETTVRDTTCVLPQVFQFEPVIYGPARGQIQQLATFPGDPDGAATAVNDKGEVVGISGICDVAVGAFSAKHALLWQNGTLTDLGNLGGKGWNTPMAINRRGDIVGFSDLSGDVTNGQLNANFHAFIWTKETGQMKDIGVLPGDSLSEALDINDQGQVVGISFPSTHAFIYEHGMMQDLNSLIPSGSPLLLLAANGINNRGEIAGQACVIADGGCPSGADTPAFLAIPTAWRRNSEFVTATQADNSDTANMPVPESVRQQIKNRLAFGHLRRSN